MPARFPEVLKDSLQATGHQQRWCDSPLQHPPCGSCFHPVTRDENPPLTPKGAALLATGLSSDPSSAACLSVLNEARGANRDVPGHRGPTPHGAAGQGWRDQSWVLPARPGTHGCPWRAGVSPEEGGTRSGRCWVAPHGPNPVPPSLSHPGDPPGLAHGYVQWWWAAARWWPCPLSETEGLRPGSTALGGRG